METGTVAFFNGHYNARYGFITVDGEKRQVHFRYEHGRNIVAGKNEPVFGDDFLRVEIRTNQKVVFIRNKDALRPKASAWGLASDYEKAKEQIAARSSKKV